MPTVAVILFVLVGLWLAVMFCWAIWDVVQEMREDRRPRTGIGKGAVPPWWGDKDDSKL